MHKSTRNLLIAFVVVLLVVVVWWWYKKDTAKIMISGIVPSAPTMTGQPVSLTITGTTSSKIDLAKWHGQKLVIRTKSLGHIVTTVNSASLDGAQLTIVTPPVSLPTGAAYVPDPSDRAHLYMKP